MGHLPIISNVYRVALIWSSVEGGSAVNVMHFQRASSTAATVANTIDANVSAGMWSAQTTDTKVVQINVTPLDGSSATYQLAVTGAKWAGTAGPTDVIPQGANIVKITTGQRGKSYRGRLFLPFVCESQSANGVIGSGAVTAGQTAWTAFLNAMSTATQPLVVASYKLGTYTLASSVIYETKMATQRRRMTRLR